MRRLMMLMLSLVGAVAHGWTPEKWFDQPLSPRIANYRIQGTLDWPGKTLQAKEVITWRNAGTKSTRDFPLHLYLNAFKGPQSLFVKESGGKLRGDSLNDPKDSQSWGYCKLRSVRLEGRDLEGHYGKDETVYWVKLPREVNPGESIEVEIAWENRYPRVFARSGWAGHFLMSGQWFPKVGVYQGDRWSCEAYHAFTEFFSDFGTYDVELSMPNLLRVAHTGTAVPYVDAQGKALHQEYMTMFDGKSSEIKGAPDPNTTRVYKRIDSRTYEYVQSVGGKLTTTARNVVSADGKTRTVTTTGKDAQGRTVNNVAVSDRQ